MASTEPNDYELMQRVAASDRAALAVLVERHQRYVWGLAFRCARRAEDADDIAQETFLRVWRAAEKFQPSARFTTWLYRIVINLCLDAKRHRGRWGTHLDPTQPVPEIDPPADPLERSETVDRVSHAIESLPQRQRVVLVLHRYQDLSHREIAEATGWSESAVESLLVRAYAGLRERLEDLRPG